MSFFFTHSILFNWNFNLMSRIIQNSTIPIEISDDDSDLYLDATPTLSQDCRALTLDDKNIWIFNAMRGNLPNILMAVKAIVAAGKKGRSRTVTDDGMGGE